MKFVGETKQNLSMITLPMWDVEDDRLVVFSRKANSYLLGSVITIGETKITEYDDRNSHTWVGDLSAAVSFGTYKHALLAVDSEDEIEGATKI